VTSRPTGRQTDDPRPPRGSDPAAPTAQPPKSDESTPRGGKDPARRSLVERHHATTGGSRIVERIGLVAYRAARGVVGRLPERLAWTLLGGVSELTYLLWPAKRRWSNVNFSHVLGLPPDHPEVRRLARRAYRTYARYLVELMRLPRMSLEDIAAHVEPKGLDYLLELWKESGGLILVAAHVGNNEMVAGGVASHRLPLSVLADDTTFPEMFDLLKRERERWGVTIVPWRNLREVFGILKRGEMLGLLVDWGYRADGIPVRLFGTWTTLPAGPAVLAARSGATILPITAHRRPDGTFFVTHEDPIRVSSTAPEEIARATQEVANALEKIVAAAPEQWYSFKPLWPVNEDERSELERRIGRLGPSDAVAEQAG
jgi:KDO2-lipid IV(A) lauroyltransferase